MSVNAKFIVDKVDVYEEYYGWSNVVSRVNARWELTHPDYPDAKVYHIFFFTLDPTAIQQESFVPIEQATDEVLEQWCLATVSAETMQEIKVAAIPALRYQQQGKGLTTYYSNPASPVTQS